ncbi:hypothetical protein XI08_40490 [Bradyrhizobium sp. CCBAU 11361]|nr:hypothetical protein [Bradyrhizobium sp. CCBAU 11361]
MGEAPATEVSDTEVVRSPHDIEVEQKLIGAILKSNETFFVVSDFLEARYFYEPLHQTIFEALAEVIREGRVATPETMRLKLPFDVDIGGMTVGQYVGRLRDDAVGGVDLALVGRSLTDLYFRRELIRLGQQIVEAASNQSGGFAQAENATSKLQELTRPSESKEPGLPFDLPSARGFHQFSRALVHAVDFAARAFVSTGSGIKTSFRDLDRKIAGLQPSELVVLASRPGMGKTALATNIAYNVARLWKSDGHNDSPVRDGGIVGFFSLEMSSEQIATRVISQQSGIPIGTIRQGAISEVDFEAIRNKAIEFQKLPFFIDETATLSIEQLAARAHRLKSEKGLDLLIIDNLDLLRAAARNNFGASKDASLQITRELKKIAREMAIPILVLAQLPSKIEKRYEPRPRLEEFGDKGSVEQDADVVLLLHRDDFYLTKEEPPFGGYEYEAWVKRMEAAYGLAEIIIAKHRNGATGTVSVYFDATTGSFNDLAT